MNQNEGVVIAEESAARSEHHAALIDRSHEEGGGKPLSITYITCMKNQRAHEGKPRGYPAPGECTPHVNVIFQAGVTF